MQWASSTLTSYSVHFISTRFGIQLTGQCAAKGQQESGSVINYIQITSYKDPPPPRAPPFVAPGKPHKSAAESPQLSGSIIVLHGQVHPLSACLISAPVSAAAEAEMNVWSRGGGRQKKKKSQRVPFRVGSPPLFLLPHCFTAIFIFCLFFFFFWLSCMHNTPLPLSLTHQSHAFYNVKATVPLPLAFLPDDIFLFLHKSNSKTCRAEEKK